MNKPLLNSLVIAAALGASAAAVMQTTRFADGTPQERERCYGIVRAGKNDCGTQSHSCAAQSRRDGDPQSWVMVPKGLCERIVGSSLHE